MNTNNSKSSSQHCQWCGKSVQPENMLVRNGKVFCCEGCFLGKLADKNYKQERDVTYLALAESLITALDAREHETGLHSKRVACHTHVLARRFTSDNEQLRQIYWGALLHDIGKIAIPDTILLKNGPLTEKEWFVMRSHPQRGYEIVAEVSFLQEASQIILYHEERYDGEGYPEGLVGESIPWGARLFSVIDTLDAITSDRPYREGKSFDEAKEEIISQSNRQFDPQAVEAFLAEETVLREMAEMKCIAQPDIWEYGET